MKIKNYKEKLLDINTFIFDVDGVLTDGKVLVTTDAKCIDLLTQKMDMRLN